MSMSQLPDANEQWDDIWRHVHWYHLPWIALLIMFGYLILGFAILFGRVRGDK